MWKFLKYVLTIGLVMTGIIARGETSTVNRATLIANFQSSTHSVSWTTDDGHVTFTLSGEGLYVDKWLGSYYFYLYATRYDTYTYDLTWEVNDKDSYGNSYYDIKVTRLAFDVDRGSGIDTHVTVGNGERSGNIYFPANIPSGGLSSGDMNEGENGKITTLVETSDLAYTNISVNSITVTYELKPRFIYDGSGDDGTQATKWEKADNWKFNELPTINDKVYILHDVVIQDKIAAYQMKIEGSSAVTIAPEGGLTIGAGGITGATKDNLKLAAGTSGSVKGKTGYLKISPAYTGEMPQATAELYSVAYFDMNAEDRNNVGSWQYVGSPMVKDEDVLARTIFTNSWIYNWDEASGEWQNNRKTLKLEPFKGYATSQYSNNDGMLINYKGQLEAQGDQVLPLSYTAASPEAGVNVLANSYAAPIDITKFENTDFLGAEATVYLFNTGSKTDVANREGQDEDVNMAGQYISIPIYLAGKDGRPSVIPSMQGFYVIATQAGATLKLNYERLVWGATNGNAPLRAPQRTQEESRGSLCIGLSADGWGDKLYLVESEDYNPAFENGYDAHKMMSGNLNIYAIEGSDTLAVDATNSIIGTRIGVRTGDETAYTMSFTHVESTDVPVLWDIETDEKIAISEGQQYTFFAEPNSVITGRFMILEAEAPSVATGVEDVQGDNVQGTKAHKFVKDGQLFILKNGVLYDATGNIVRK